MIILIFIRFSKEEISSNTKVKQSIQRNITKTIQKQYPTLFETISSVIIPKKTPIYLAKCQNHINLIIVEKVPVFFQYRDGPYFPTLKILHKC
jgi:malignant T-cell-amplified sequence